MAISAEEAKQLLNDHISQEEAANLLQDQSQSSQQRDPYNIVSRGALAGLLNFGRGIPNTAFRLAQLAGIPEGKYFHPVTEEQIGLNKIISPEERKSFAGGLGEFIGGAIPITQLPIGGASSLMGRLGKSALAGAALGPIYNPDESLPESAALGAGLGAGLTGLGGIARGIFGKMGGTNTAEQVAKILEAEVPGQEVPLAEAIESPYLKWFQSSILGQLPFSSMKKKYLEIDKGNIKRMEDILGHQDISNASNEIVSNLSDKYAKNQIIKKNLYDLVSKKADEYGVKLNDENYINTIKDILQPIEKVKKQKPHFKKMSQDDDFVNFLKEEIKDKEYIDPLTGKNIANKSDYNTAAITDAEINGRIEEAYQENDRMKVGLLKKIQSSLREDMDKSVKEAGIPELTKDWDNARNFYKNEIVPLQHKNILPFILGQKPAETIIPFFIKRTKFERPDLAKQLLTHLSPDNKEKVAEYFLTSGGSKEEAQNIAQMYGNLGKETRKLLFPEKQRKEIESSMEIAKALGGQKGQMFVPKTGYQALGGLGTLGIALSAPAILPKIAAGGAILGSANLLTKALTNKKSRNFLINRYLNSINKNNKQKANLSKYAQPALQSLLSGEQ